jgi:transposase InsO family protein
LIIQLIREAVMQGARKHKACEILGLSLRAVQRWEKNGLDDKRKHNRRRPSNKLSEVEQQQILKIANSDEFKDFAPSQIVPRLADKGVYIASESTFYRILRQAGQNAHRSTSKPRKNKSPKSLTATGPNQIWSWDITYLPAPIRGTYWYLYMIIDIYSRKIVGWDVHNTEDSQHAAQLIQSACRAENIVKDQLVLHSDNGSPMKGSIMLAKLQDLGVMASFSRPAVSNDNPFSESLFRTCKYRPNYPEKPFESLQAAREWVEQFVIWYNTLHLHSKLKFVTPRDRHQERDKEILAARHQVYQAARKKRPERWARKTRNWSALGKVELNPKHHKKSEKRNMA